MLRGTAGVQSGYSWGTLRIQWGTVRVQQGYSGTGCVWWCVWCGGGGGDGGGGEGVWWFVCGVCVSVWLHGSLHKCVCVFVCALTHVLCPLNNS